MEFAEVTDPNKTYNKRVPEKKSEAEVSVVGKENQRRKL